MSHIEKHVNLSALHELHLENRRQLKTVDFNHKLGFASLSTCVILIIALMVFILIKHRRAGKLEDCSGRAILKEGLVKDGLPPSPPVPKSTAQPGPECTSTEAAESAVFELDTTGCHRNAKASSVSTSVDDPSRQALSLGAKLAVLGKRAGQLGL